MSEKIMFLCCGSRQGNTYWASKVAADAAEKAGAMVELVEAVTLSGIGRGCVSCMSCRNSPEFKCVFDDDVTDLLSRLHCFDTIVIAAPVYFFSFGLQAKGIIDRFMSLVKSNGEEITSPLQGKKFALLTTSGSGEGDSGVKMLRQSYEAIVDYMGATSVGELYFPHCDITRGGLKTDIEMPDQASAFGRMLAGADR